jgi:hypothetical protein
VQRVEIEGINNDIEHNLFGKSLTWGRNVKCYTQNNVNYLGSGKSHNYQETIGIANRAFWS